MRQLALALILGGCIAQASPGVEASTTHELKLPDKPSLVVENDGGSVEIVPGSEGTLRVEARRRAGTREEALALPVTVQLEGANAVVRYHEPGRPPSHSVTFVIHAPPATRLQLSTGGGSISTTKMGDQTLRSGGGAIVATSAEGNLQARTGGGSIQVSGRLRGASKVSTGGGSVHVAIPADSRLRVDGATGGGSLHNDFGLSVEGVGTRRMSGTVGDGRDGSLELRTGGGSLELSRL